MRSYFNLRVIFYTFAILPWWATGHPTSTPEIDAGAIIISMMDRNGDEKLSPAELYHFDTQIAKINLSNDTIAAEFKALDLDHDGFITSPEIAIPKDGKPVKKIKQKGSGKEVIDLADKDKNGVVSMAEAKDFFTANARVALSKAALEIEIKFLDKNNDGVLSESELEPENSSII